MGLNQITLTDYDTVVAVTQASVNETLAVFLSKLQKQVALYYNPHFRDDSFVPVTGPPAMYAFTGTLDYTLDANGNPVNIVELYTGKGPQTVRYNLTFRDAEFKATVPKIDAKQEPGSDPWIIQFLVKLSQKDVEFASLPEATQTMISNAVDNLNPDMFSIQQLYLDLNTAVFDTFQNIEGMSQIAEGLLSRIMQLYVASLQSSGGIIFGYSTKAAPANLQPPTFMPTALDFCVTPYTDSTGSHSNSSLDTLNYLMMTNNRALPASPPTGFGFNWVDDPSLQGAMAVRHGLFIDYLIPQLNSILKPMCPVCHVKAHPHKSIDEQTMELNPGVDHTFQILKEVSSGVVAGFDYKSPEAQDSVNVFGGSVSVSLDYKMTCNVLVKGSSVTLAGTFVVSADSDENTGTGEVDHEMPPTTYTWSVDLVLQMDPASNGRLYYAIRNANFSSEPTVNKKHHSKWDKFWAAVGGSFKQFVLDLDNIRATIQSQVISGIQPALTASINSSNSFVFPGGTTFVFKNPQFTNSDDLAANITYLTPSV